MKYRSSSYLALLLFIALVGLCPGLVQAQINIDKARSGSIYSYLGIGVPADFNSADADPMGLNGVSFYDPYVPGMANPAQWGSAIYTKASGGLLLQRFQAKDPFTSATNVNLSATHFQSVFPLIKNKLGLSVSLTPITRSSYRAISDVTLDPSENNSGGSLRYIVENRGNGGFDQFELGLGWRINKMFSIGYAGSMVFGEVQNDLSVIYDQENFQPSIINQELYGKAFRQRLGLFVNRPNIFGDEDELSGGVSMTLPTIIDGEFSQTAEIELRGGVREFPIDEGKTAGDIQLPMGVDGGLAYRFSQNITVASELRYQQWSEYENFAKSDDENFVDRLKIGGGIKYLPYLKTTSTFLSRLKYYAGVSYDTGHLSINGERIQTVLGSLGIGIPAPRTRSSVHISLQYGMRGTQNADLVREQIWSVRVSFNLAEMMFVQSKFQ
ncbi:MAG: hypothetical protein ACQETE_03720 [Bacteroidota bacterium]